MITSVKIRKQSSKIQAGRRSHHQEYVVRFDTIAASNSADAMTASDGTTIVPAYGEAHSSADGTYCSNVSADGENKSMTVFIVGVDFEQPQTPAGSDGNYEDPLTRPPDISWDYEETTEDYFRDTEDSPVTNVIGEPFDTNPSREAGRLYITYEWNDLFNDAATNDTFSNTLNDANVTIDGTIYSAGMLKMSPIKARKVTENVNGVATTYYRKSVVIKVKAEGWDDTFENRGYYETADWIPITDDAGNQVAKPWPLDSSGNALSSGDLDPSTLTFKPYERVSWASFNFA
jgi:hypothetical protein